jgi:hypothetical protein
MAKVRLCKRKFIFVEKKSKKDHIEYKYLLKKIIDQIDESLKSKMKISRENKEGTEDKFMMMIRRNKAKKQGFTPLVRPNGTSDIPYENLIVHDGKNIFELFPDVQFYDYTKHPGRNLNGKTPGNYDLTYSFSAITPKPISIKGLTNPNNSRVAVVFQKQGDIPDNFRGWPVIDGDNTDVRHIEPKAVVVALYAKGKAKRDFSGFTQIKGVHYA